MADTENLWINFFRRNEATCFLHWARICVIVDTSWTIHKCALGTRLGTLDKVKVCWWEPVVLWGQVYLFEINGKTHILAWVYTQTQAQAQIQAHTQAHTHKQQTYNLQSHPRQNRILFFVHLVLLCAAHCSVSSLSLTAVSVFPQYCQAFHSMALSCFLCFCIM